MQKRQIGWAKYASQNGLLEHNHNIIYEFVIDMEQTGSDIVHFKEDHLESAFYGIS